MSVRQLGLIFGDQLNADSPLFAALDPTHDRLWMAEVLAESREPRSSWQRSVVFLSAMRHFAAALREQGWPLDYHPITAALPDFATALQHSIAAHRPQQILAVLPGDQRVVEAINQLAQTLEIPLQWLPDTHFLAEPGQFRAWLKGRKQPLMEHWYRHLRRALGVLMDADGQPTGGQWNFDADNRQAFGREGPQQAAACTPCPPDAITTQVIADLQQQLPELVGDPAACYWPVDRPAALAALAHFIEHHLPQFGTYQDAMWMDEPFLHHARLSSSLNLKLLNPREVIAAAVSAYTAGHAPINAVEGFVRQILGWREYIRGLYWAHRTEWLDMNALQAHRPLPQWYWNADTPMVCLQQAISQVLRTGYGHHIQRLMVTGLFALLWGVKPQAIHDWYLAMYVDAVAWVEIPNTLGMSQYADGGLVGTKPYIASGAYIDRQSNYCAHCQFQPKHASGDQACPFTTLYWAFVDRHAERLARNPRLGMQVKNWQRKSAEAQAAIRARADWCFQTLDNAPAQKESA